MTGTVAAYLQKMDAASPGSTTHWPALILQHAARQLANTLCVTHRVFACLPIMGQSSEAEA